MSDRAIKCFIAGLVIVPCLGSAQAALGEAKGERSARAVPAHGTESSGGRALVGCCVINAVPEPECIPSIEEADCLAMGGVPIDNITCTGDPCNGTGACCLPGGVCQDGSNPTACALAGGQFVPGVTCIADDPCPTCDIGDTAHCQLNDGGFIVQNDRMLGVRWADDFSPSTTGPIERVCWWPCWFNPNVPEECSDEADKPPDDFVIRWYADAGGLPGAEIGMPGGEPLIPDATSPIDANRCWNYTAPVTTPPIVTAGECYWIEITGMGDPATGCTVYWNNNNSSGNSYSLNDQNGDYTTGDMQFAIGDEASDMSFCLDSGLEAGSCTHVGACCLPDLTCQDDMPFADCLAAGGWFKLGRRCIDNICCVSCDCPNDECVDAIDLDGPEYCNGGGLPCTFDFANVGCETRPTAVNCQCSMPCQDGGPIESMDLGSTKWYTWRPQPGESGTILFDMCGHAAYDGAAAVYEGGADCSECPANLVDTLAAHDDCGTGGGPPRFCFDAVEGNCYFLSIGGWNGEQGSGTVELSLDIDPCYTPRPIPDDRFDIENAVRTCTTDADCSAGLHTGTEATCILGEGGATPGICYVHKNRYVSIDPNPANAGRLTARRISLDLGGGTTQVLGWVGPPAERVVAGPESSPQLLARIISAPYYRDWSVNDQGVPWANPTVNVGDCATSPGWTYIIQAIDSLCDEQVSQHYSEALTLSAVANFGDVTGASAGQPPEQSRSFKDISALTQGFQGDQKVPAVWLDLTGPLVRPECPDFADLNFADIQITVSGFQGGDYPYPPPTECPPDACPYP